MDPNVTPLSPPVPPPAGGPTPPADQEYIRTFAEDMETLKKGGAPELHPFDKKVAVQPPPPPAPPVPPPPAPVAEKSAPPPMPIEMPPQPAPIPRSTSREGSGLSLQQATEQEFFTEPKKYIRTFAADMETMKKGGVPDLTPFEKKAAPEAAPEAPQAEVTLPAMVMELPFQLPPIPQVSKAPFPRPAQPPPRSAPPSSPPPPPTPPEVKPIPLQTYANDFSQKIQETQASTATILAAEQDAKKGAPQIAPTRAHSGAATVIVSVILVLLGVSIIYFTYVQYRKPAAPVVVLTPTITTPISVDEKQQLTGATPSALFEAIQQSVARALPVNAVRLLYTDVATTTGNSVFSALRLPAPDVLLRNVNASRSMAGVVNVNGVQTPFFILSVASYGDTFAGMLAWEVSMPKDLRALFPAYPAPVVATTTVEIATTTATSTKATAKKTTAVPAQKAVATTTPAIIPVFFHDEVVANHDTRIYRDASGRPLLMYGYWDKATLVIARDPAAFTAILERLANVRSK